MTIGGVQFAVIGILDALPLHPDLDRSVFIGTEAAERFLGAEVIPTRIYLRADPEQLERVRERARTRRSTRRHRTRSTCRGRRTRSRRGRASTRDCGGCCSDWARWRSSSAASASPT